MTQILDFLRLYLSQFSIAPRSGAIVAIQPHGSYAPAASAWLGNWVACVEKLLQMDT